MRRPALAVNAATAGGGSPPDERFERAADVIDRLSPPVRERWSPSCTENEPPWVKTAMERLDNEPRPRDPVHLSLVPKTAPLRIAYVRNG